MQARPKFTSTTFPLAGRFFWWLYNVAMVMGALLWSPLLFAVVTASKKRRRSAAQRLGWVRQERRYDDAGPVPAIWVHALSVGEVTAAQPLVRRLMQRPGRYRVVVTASTHTGYATARRLFADDRLEVAYFPYDLIFSVRAAARRIDPAMAILVETDIWPNFISEMNRRNVPVYLANFRLSDQTWRKCRAFKGLSGTLFRSFARIFVQSRRDARRLQRLGVAPGLLCVAGSLKFDTSDRPLAGQLVGFWRRRLRIQDRRPVIVAGSTHLGDEAALLTALAAIRESDPPKDARMIIAPRDPARTGSILALCREAGVSCRRLSELQDNASIPCPDVVLVDYIGVLKELYCLATVAFVGGSLSTEGGHNPLEPAVYGKPIVFGPDMRDFRQMKDWLLAAKGARQVMDSQDLGPAFSELLHDPQAAASMGGRALAVFQSHGGAVAKIVENLELP